MNQVTENLVKNREEASHTALLLISGSLITLYLTANLMAVKLISIFGITIFDAGTITFPFAYMLGDVLTEIWGFKAAKRVIVLSFFCNILMVLATTVGVYLPYPDYTAETANAYAQIFGYVPRIVIASLISFLIGELSNSWSLIKIREKTGGKHLWVRTIGSSVIGHMLDTSLFVILAFAGTAPFIDLLSMIGIQYVFKLGVEAICATPIAYLMIYKLRKKLGIPHPGEKA